MEESFSNSVPDYSLEYPWNLRQHYAGTAWTDMTWNSIDCVVYSFLLSYNSTSEKWWSMCTTMIHISLFFSEH